MVKYNIKLLYLGAGFLSVNSSKLKRFLGISAVESNGVSAIIFMINFLSYELSVICHITSALWYFWADNTLE